MKRATVKKVIACAAATLTLCLSATFCGCEMMGGRDGVDGKDLNIYDIWEAVKVETGRPSLSFDEFLKEYFNDVSSDISSQATLQGSINRSLLSAVSVQAAITRTEASDGSGVIVDIDKEKGDMTVVTNCHVVYSVKAGGDNYSDNIHVWLYGSESEYTEIYSRSAIPAQLIAASKAYDVAVLKVTGSDLVKKSQAIAAKWTAAEESYVGETVYAIGNANSQKLSANVGYISKDYEHITVDLGDKNYNGTVKYYEYGVLRTSAFINSGNSGGGLFKTGGELVGLVNAKGKSDATGFGFALPASSTKRAVQSLIDTYNAESEEVHYINRVKHGINVTVEDMYSTGLNENGYAEIYEKVVVTGAQGAASGKLQGGDILKAIKIVRGGNEVVENLAINREHNFHDVMLSVRAGDEVKFTVERNGETVETSVAFGLSDFEKIA